MKVWNFNAESNPKEISKKLASALGSVDGLVFHLKHEKNNSITFKMRKRILYAWYLIFQNSIIVNGKLLKSDTENKTRVEISFTQHFLMTFLIIANIIAGFGFLIAIASGIGNSPAFFIIAIIPLVLGIVLWIDLQKRFDRKVQEYKTLISEVLAF